MSVYHKDNFVGRVNHAISVICRKGDTTRHFDTCFEMFDGGAVGAAIWRRSLKNRTLAANLPLYLDVDSIRQASERLAGQSLAEAAEAMRVARAAIENSEVNEKPPVEGEEGYGLYKYLQQQA